MADSELNGKPARAAWWVRMAAGAGLAVVALAGCSGGSSDEPPPAPPAVEGEAPAEGGEQSEASQIVTGDEARARLPENFPVPEGATDFQANTIQGSVGVLMTVPDGKAALDFYRQQLPAAGYTVQEGAPPEMVPFSGGDIGGGTVTAQGNQVAIAIYSPVGGGSGS